VIASAYLGLAPLTVPSLPSYKQSDKVLHFVTFFLLTLCFYWIIETNRRRNLQLAVFVCTIILGIGSEVVQGLLPNGRDFDPYDIVANILGTLPALAICTWYHRRMLERKRLSKNYNLVPGEELDLELGEGVGAEHEGQETGVIPGQTLEQEVDNWDENAEDWDDDDLPTTSGTEEGEGPKTPGSSVDDPVVETVVKKRSD